MTRLNKTLLKMAEDVMSGQKAAAVPADPTAAGGAAPGGMPADPMAAGGAAPGGMPADPMATQAATGAVPPGAAGPMAAAPPPAPAPASSGGGGGGGKNKIDPMLVERRLYKIEKLLTLLANSAGVEIPPELTVDPPAAEMQAQLDAQSATLEQEQAAAEMGVPPNGQGGAPEGAPAAAAGTGSPPPGGGIGQMTGVDAMGGAKLASEGSDDVSIGAPIATPQRVQEKAGAVTAVWRARAARGNAQKSA